jgi:hypothetical protein
VLWASNPVKDHLAVRKGHVGRATHRSQVVAPVLRGERCAGEFAIDDRETKPGGHRPQEFVEIIGRHLVAEAATPAVKHDHHLLGAIEVEGTGEMLVEDAVAAEHLDFEVVVA